MKIKLKDISTKAPGDITKKESRKKLEKLQKKLFSLHNLMNAEGKHAILVILQGLDASGKDGTIKHVFSHVNPADCVVTSFKAPTLLELSHDWMWRIYPHFPAKGILQIHNRSYYEDIIVPTIHKQLPKDIISKRMDFINAIENHLSVTGTIILKFYLHISQEEEHERLNKRREDPTRHWKYDPADKNTEEHFKDFIKVYDHILNTCNDPVPWHIVPADNKWYRDYFILTTIVDTLEGLDMKYPD
jgi:PPK2 family polyphosphate:nucleotide phosphotransferase